MTLTINVPSTENDLSPKITVIGVGGAGGNAVNNMIQSNLEGVEFLVANSDAQSLQQSLCDRHVQLGRNVTRGLGAGSRPDVGRAAAEEALDEILSHLEGANMVFVTAGMGGGTGTGAAPVIARAAREAGILTVGVVTKPFHFEGVHRMRLAESGINELTQYVDTLIIIPNQNLFRVANEKTTFADAFKMADDVLDSGVRGVTDLMVHPGLINLDFADIRSVMSEMGKAMMGTGEAQGENRATEAAEAAISNPLLDDVSMKGARGVLINITGGLDMTLFEVDEAANRIRDEVDPEANIIFGSTFAQDLEGTMRVSVVATGIDVEAIANPKPVSLSVVSAESRPAPVKAPEPAAATVASPMGIGADTPHPAHLNGGAKTASPAMALRKLQADVALEAQTIGQDIDEEPAPVAEQRVVEQRVVEQPVMAEPEPAPPVAEEAPVEAQASAPATKSTGNGSAFFAAPPPVEPQSSFKQAAPAAKEPEMPQASATPQASAAALQAEVPSFHRKAAQSLFARVTGGAARALNAAKAGAEPGAMDESAQRGSQEPTLTATAQSPKPATSPARAPAQASQPRLTGLDAPESPNAGNGEEEILDIPAFLRRQAN